MDIYVFCNLVYVKKYCIIDYYIFFIYVYGIYIYMNILFCLIWKLYLDLKVKLN